MKKLYLDCDGVILDTINKSYEELKRMNITDDNDVQAYYRGLNWEDFIYEAGEIDNATDKILKLSEVFDVEILTHVNSLKEAKAKEIYFGKKIPDVNVIPVPKKIMKADYVYPDGAILVDDFLPNLEYWEKMGGIPIKFSDSGKKCKYITITDLNDIFNLNFDKIVKIKK